MDGKIRGSFPGGPRKKVPASERTSAPRLERVEDIEERRAQSRVRRERSRRGKRTLYVFLGSVVVSGGVGVYLGSQNATSLDEIRASQQEEVGADDAAAEMTEISAEINRVLLELWKMEDVEQLRNSR